MSVDDFQLVCGPITPHEARVYVRWCGASAGDVAGLQGTITGPYCHYATTLTATIPFRPLTGGGDLVAEAVVPDPCFWSPQAPYWYRVRLEWPSAAARAPHEQTLGFRPLGAVRHRLYYAAKNWVLRAIDPLCIPPTDAEVWRATGTVMYVHQPASDLCHDGSRKGILLVARLGGDAPAIQSALRRLARFPAVAMAVIESPQSATANLQGAAPNILLGELARGEPFTPAAWARFVVWSASRWPPESWPDLASLSLPLVVALDVDRPGEFLEMRAQCDRLQADLAGRGPIAGYVIASQE
jgi:hypothetical protein